MKSSGVLATLMLAVALFGAAQATDCTWTAAPTEADCQAACGVLDTQTEATAADVFLCKATTPGTEPATGGACATLAATACGTATECETDTPAGAACGAKTPYTCVDGDNSGTCTITACVLAASPVGGALCTSACEQALTQVITTPAAGGGTACGSLATYDCQPGDGACPAVTYSWTSAIANDAVAFTCSTTPGAAAETLTRATTCTASDGSTVADASASCPDSGATTVAAKTAVMEKDCPAVANVCSSDTTNVCTGTAVKVDTGTCAAKDCVIGDFGDATKACCEAPKPLCSTVTTGNTCTGTAVAAASTATCAASTCDASTDFGDATTACCQAPPVACSTKTTGNTCTGGAVLDAGTKLCAADPCDASDFGAATTNCCKAKPPAPPASGAATAAVSLTALLALVLA